MGGDVKGKDAPSGKRPAPSSGATRHLPPTGGRLQQYRELCSFPGNGLSLSVKSCGFASSPKGRALGMTVNFLVKTQSEWFRQSLSLWERWHRAAMTERASPLTAAPRFRRKRRGSCRLPLRPHRENAMPERPQTLRHCSIINNISADDAQSKAERIQILFLRTPPRRPDAPAKRTAMPRRTGSPP